MKLSLAQTLTFAALLGSCMSTDTQDELQIEERQINTPLQRYYSSIAKNPPVQVSKSGKALAPGYMFLAPQTGTVLPMIMTQEGELVWAGTSKIYAGTDLRKQTLNGQDVLTFYRGYGNSNLGFSFGSTVILDQHYNVIHEVCPKLGLYATYEPNTPLCQGDLHEQEISPDGTVLITAYNSTQTDLSGVPGADPSATNAWVVEAQFYELALDGTILFEWHSLQHVPVTKTMTPLAKGRGDNASFPFDYFHINSVQKVGNQYLIDGRNVWSSYLINPDGSVEWSFNGYDGGSFSPLPNAPTGIPGRLFSFQHLARLEDVTQNSAVLTLFNNDYNTASDTSVPSTGFAFLLNYVDMTCELVHDYYDPKEPIGSVAEGSYFTLPNGNVLLGYGNAPVYKEFGPKNNTDVRLTFTYGPGPRFGSYRAYKAEWIGLPNTKPSVAIQAESGKGYVSWNGATEVTTYTVLAGTPKKLKKYTSVPKSGFETSFDLPTNMKVGKYIQVVAYKGEQMLGNSTITKYRP